MLSALRSAAVIDDAANAYCSLSLPYTSTMMRRPVIRNAPKRSHERSSDSRNATSAESSETKVSISGKSFMMSKNGMNVSFGLVEASKT